MSNKEQKNWEKNLHQQDTSQEKFGTSPKANLSGKKQGELYQRSLKYNQELQKEQDTEKTVSHKKQKTQ